MDDQLEAYRLTEEDEGRVTARIDETLADWKRAGHSRPVAVGTVEWETLRRLAFHSIGCSVHDLRDSEIAWVEAAMRERVAS